MALLGSEETFSLSKNNRLHNIAQSAVAKSAHIGVSFLLRNIF